MKRKLIICWECTHFRAKTDKDRQAESVQDRTHKYWCSKLAIGTGVFLLRCGGDDFERKQTAVTKGE